MPDIFDASQHSSKQNTSADTETAAGLIDEASEQLVTDSGVSEATSAETGPAPETATSTDDPISLAFKAAQQRKDNAIAQLMENLKVSSNPLGAFSMQPKNTCVDIQMENEEVLLLLRQHPVTQIRWVLTAIVMIFVPFLFSYVPFLDFLPLKFHLIALVGWYLMIVGFSLESFLSWFYNTYVVTNERVIDIDFNSLLFKNISTAKLDRIEDVTVTNKGYLGSIFDYGTVLIQTAGAVDEFEFGEVPHPSRVSTFINDLLEEEEELERREISHAG